MKFYQEVMQYENDSIELGKMLDNEAILLLDQYKETFNSDDLEIIRTLMYELAYEAEKAGYMLGVKSVIHIIAELYAKDL